MSASCAVARALIVAFAAASIPATARGRPPAGPFPSGARPAPGAGFPDGSLLRLSSPRSRMVRIPASVFRMGSEQPDVLGALSDCVAEPYGHRCSPTLFGNEMPSHVVHLSSYWIDRFEVRVDEYERCVAVGACLPRPTSGGTARFDRAFFPVSRVTWHDARRFCAFREARLPTEAEFERAARGERGRRYPWGELFNAWAANHGRFGWDETDATDGFAELAPVGSFPEGATPEGVYDLAGNVAEWVFDRYAPTYPAAAERNPRGPGIGTSSLRVVRGGSYAMSRARMRGASRGSADPSERRTTIGFRCARAARGARGMAPVGEAPAGEAD